MPDINYEAIRQRLVKRFHQGGEELKNDLPNILRAAIQSKAWEHFSDLEGRPFPNLVAWLMYQTPHGTALGDAVHALSFKDLVKLTEVAPDVQRVLLEQAPTRPAHRPKKRGVDTPLSVTRHNYSKSALTLSVRLAQEKPRFYEAYTRGQYRSVTAAAIAAGLLTSNVNIRRAKSAYRRLTPAERRAFQAWTKTADAAMRVSSNGHDKTAGTPAH